ncbi:MAG: hypothetical protein PHI19_07685, partial [Clostridia bacterium]|nr:hypothetical protein [Clostridia bacterium]
LWACSKANNGEPQPPQKNVAVSSFAALFALARAYHAKLPSRTFRGINRRLNAFETIAENGIKIYVLNP